MGAKKKTKKTEKRGGRRAGAGRHPRVPGDRTRSVGVTLRGSTLEWVDSQTTPAHGRSRVIEDVVRAAMAAELEAAGTLASSSPFFHLTTDQLFMDPKRRDLGYGLLESLERAARQHDPAGCMRFHEPAEFQSRLAAEVLPATDSGLGYFLVAFLVRLGLGGWIQDDVRKAYKKLFRDAPNP